MYKIRVKNENDFEFPALPTYSIFFISDSMNKEDSHDHEVNFMRG